MGHNSQAGWHLRPIISPNSRVRYPEHLVVGAYSIIDDFCYLSTKVRIGQCSHIASGCSIAGGVERQFVLGDFSSLSSGVKVWCTSDNFTNDIVTILPEEAGPIKSKLIAGDVIIGDFTAVGSNAVIMPNNHIPIGSVIGALSFVPAGFDFKPWSIYAGIPIRYIGQRNRDNVLAQTEKLKEFFKEKHEHDA